MHAETAERPLLEGQVEPRRGRARGIERAAVVLDLDRDLAGVRHEPHDDRMLALVVVSVEDDVGDDLVRRELKVEDHRRGKPRGPAELLDDTVQALELREVVRDGDRLALLIGDAQPR